MANTNIERVTLPTNLELYRGIEWQDGITPLNAHNLNAMHDALDYLLNEEGYVPTLIEALKQEIQDRIDAIDNLDQTLSTAINNEATARKTADNNLSKSIDALGIYVERVDSEHQDTITELNNCKEDVEKLQRDLTNLTTRVKTEEDQTLEFVNNINDILDRLTVLDTLKSKTFIEANDEVVLKCGGALDNDFN